MKFIVGGEYAGKLKFALKISGMTEEDVVDCKYADIENLKNKLIINNFNIVVKKMAKIYNSDKIIKIRL